MRHFPARLTAFSGIGNAHVSPRCPDDRHSRPGRPLSLRVALCSAGWALCRDTLTGKSFEHRKAIVARRILALGDILAVGIYAYTVMSNHVHVVLSVLPDRARDCADSEVAERWLALFPATDEQS